MGKIIETRRIGAEVGGKVIPLPDLAKALEHLATALEIFIQLERQAYAMDYKVLKKTIF